MPKQKKKAKVIKQTKLITPAAAVEPEPEPESTPLQEIEDYNAKVEQLRIKKLNLDL